MTSASVQRLRRQAQVTWYGFTADSSFVTNRFNRRATPAHRSRRPWVAAPTEGEVIEAGRQLEQWQAGGAVRNGFEARWRDACGRPTSERWYRACRHRERDETRPCRHSRSILAGVHRSGVFGLDQALDVRQSRGLPQQGVMRRLPVADWWHECPDAGSRLRNSPLGRLGATGGVRERRTQV